MSDLPSAPQRGAARTGEAGACGPRSELGVPAQILLVVATLEVAVNRIAVPLLAPVGAAPAWYVGLYYGGLFLLYFTTTLAALLLVSRVLATLRLRLPWREWLAERWLFAATVLAVVPLVAVPPDPVVLALQLAFGIAVITLVAASLGDERDLGLMVGIGLVAAPLVLHAINAIGSQFVWSEGPLGAPSTTLARTGVMALAVVALISPYVFAPRPFSRAVARPVPVLVAMTIAAATAIATRANYAAISKTAALAVGVELDQRAADPRLALYLLSIATLVWTLVSCAIAPAPARRVVGAGIAFVVLGGYAFHWPEHYLLPLYGLALLQRASKRVRDEELALMPLRSGTPPIADAMWATYAAAIKAALERSLTGVQALTTRGDGDLASTLVVGEARGLAVRTRIERIESCVIALDVVVGSEIGEARGATFTLWAPPPRGAGANPSGPPAAPPFKTADAPFDERFRARGDAAAFARVFDADLRARATATLDGWLAYWAGEGLRYRVYPGRGAPLDHPLPLSDLALGRAATADRLAAVIDLLVELGARGLAQSEPHREAEVEAEVAT